ncbi:Asp-tRNA(Asn)/Glu-tRNA(Gln) amidotransferase subunit GatC [Patescibacteria group bacterium]|nr:Asp-tRNA(Asn)/Glu-tRNA(Gln) amidotransferase subunit GatC [Patescibacteria group bacterium]MBU3923035.1 Asp-tRNA(Asn)/Glu-tRNA(Gln) amidotransferase subunit GatC [Patescibacteria group bacterium]
MSNISKKDIQHIAKLARIELIDKEEEKFQKDLSSILDFVEKLNKVNTDNVDRLSQVTGLENIVREDKVNSKEKYELLKQVPNKKGKYIKVPKILE